MSSLHALPTPFPSSCSCFNGHLTAKKSYLGLILTPPVLASRTCDRRIPRLHLSRRGKVEILVRIPRRKVSVLVRANRGLNFNGGGGGDWDRNSTSRVMGNLALAIFLTYLTMTGQLGWLLDAIVSIWLLAVLLPILGLGAFFWFAGRDIVRGSCPTCGNDFQILKSSLIEGRQLCPYCSQPFSVEGDKFVRESTGYSPDQSTTYKQAFDEYSSQFNRETSKRTTKVVDIEAEVRDAE